MENIVEKIKEYKIFLLLSLGGLLIGGFFLFRPSVSKPSTIENLYQETSQSASTSSAESSPQMEEKVETSVETVEMMTVDVKGAVKQPGVYELKPGSRVHDAIYKAGGLTTEANSRSVNLAQKLTDEAVIYVATEGEEVAAVQSSAGNSTATGSTEKDLKVNLNRASEAELQTVSGIGQKKAQDIIAYRDANGPFKSIDDLKNVSGIGAKTVEKLRDALTID